MSQENQRKLEKVLEEADWSQMSIEEQEKFVFDYHLNSEGFAELYGDVSPVISKSRFLKLLTGEWDEGWTAGFEAGKRFNYEDVYIDGQLDGQCELLETLYNTYVDKGSSGLEAKVLELCEPYLEDEEVSE